MSTPTPQSRSLALLQKYSPVVAVVSAIAAIASVGFFWWYSQSQWSIVKQQLISVQRPFVIATKIVVLPIGTPQAGVVRLRVQWENSGNTPTRNLRTYTNIVIRRERAPQGYHFPDLDEKGREVKSAQGIHSFIPPHGTTLSKGYFDAPVASVPDIGKTLYLYVWGWARYRDIFADTSEHITRFCFEVSEILMDVSNVIITAAQCAENNCMDGECEETRR